MHYQLGRTTIRDSLLSKEPYMFHDSFMFVPKYFLNILPIFSEYSLNILSMYSPNIPQIFSEYSLKILPILSLNGQLDVNIFSKLSPNIL